MLRLAKQILLAFHEILVALSMISFVLIAMIGMSLFFVAYFYSEPTVWAMNLAQNSHKLIFQFLGTSLYWQIPIVYERFKTIWISSGKDTLSLPWQKS